MSKVKCLHCGVENDPEQAAGYCDECGKKLPGQYLPRRQPAPEPHTEPERQVTAPSWPPKKSGGFGWTFWMIVIIAVTGGVGYCLYEVNQINHAVWKDFDRTIGPGIQPAPPGFEAGVSELQGIWSETSWNDEGQNRDGEVNGVQWNITGNNIVISSKIINKIPGMVRVDSTKNPKRLDVSIPGNELRGIFERNGDTLRFCYVQEFLSHKERPDAFKAAPGTGRYLVVFRQERN